MTLLDIAGLIVVASALVMYGYMVRTGEAIWFHWINALGGIITTASAYQHRAWPGLLAAVAYGLIGAWGVIKWVRWRNHWLRRLGRRHRKLNLVPLDEELRDAVWRTKLP